MQLTLAFDTDNKTDLTFLNKILDLASSMQDAQPAVAQNTGTTGPEVSTLSSGASGVDEGAATAAAPVTEKAKRTRKPKEEKPEVVTGQEWKAAAEQVEKPVDTQAAEEPAPLEAAPAEAAAASPSKVYSLDEVRAALQQFTAAKGVPAGIELLKKFGAGRISELADTDYASFVAECAA